jgi:hypothetical protein
LADGLSSSAGRGRFRVSAFGRRMAHETMPVRACAGRFCVFVSAGAVYIRCRLPVACQATGDCLISSALGKKLVYGYGKHRVMIHCAEQELCLPLCASERPIAIACFRLLTGLPDFPDLSLPSFISCIALLTFVAAFGPYCLLDDLIDIFLSSISTGSM